MVGLLIGKTINPNHSDMAEVQELYEQVKIDLMLLGYNG